MLFSILVALNSFYLVAGEYDIIVIHSNNESSVLVKDRGVYNSFTTFQVDMKNIFRPRRVYRSILKYNTTSDKWESFHHHLVSRIVKEGSKVSLEIYDWMKNKWVNRSEIKLSNKDFGEILNHIGIKSPMISDTLKYQIRNVILIALGIIVIILLCLVLPTSLMCCCWCKVCCH